MEKRFAEFISYIFHPLLMPTYLLVLFLNLPVFVFNEYSFNLKLMLTGYVFLLTFFVPAMMMLMMKKNKIIRSLKMEERSERMLPLAFMSVIYYITYYFLNRLGVLNIYSLFLLGTTLTTLITMLINFRWKISLHMIGVGGISGVMVALAYQVSEINILWVYGVLFVSGLVAYARILTAQHTVRQLFYGYLLGFSIMFFLMVAI
jgi:hypothetical protein